MAGKDFPDISPDANPSFTLENNTTSFESTLNKNVQHMELPGARWRGSVAFSNRTRQEANKIKAFMTSLGGQVGRFYLTPFDAYQSGTMFGTGVVDGAVASGVSSIPTKGWEGDQDTLFEAGDYIEVNGELKMVTDDVAAPQSYIEYTGTNYMPSPFDPEGWSGDPDGTITNVTLDNPSGTGIIGLAEQTGTNYFSVNSSFFNQFNMQAGDNIFIAIMYKLIIGSEIESLTLEAYSSEGTLTYSRFDAANKTQISGTVTDYLFTDLSDGHVLLQAKVNSTIARTSAYGGIRLYKADGGIPAAGEQIYVQASYIGVADDWPAQLLATADIPIAPPLRKPLAGGESITVVNPKGKFYLGSNDQSWDINVNGVQSMGFDFVEDVN